MPAESKKQQMAAGMALAAKEGKMDPSELKGAAKQMYDSMTVEQLREYAQTKHTNLPEKKKEASLIMQGFMEEIDKLGANRLGLAWRALRGTLKPSSVAKWHKVKKLGGKQAYEGYMKGIEKMRGIAAKRGKGAGGAAGSALGFAKKHPLTTAAGGGILAGDLLDPVQGKNRRGGGTYYFG